MHSDTADRQHPDVLVVEDDRDTREILLMWLESQGFCAVGADNGASAMHLLLSGTEPGVILLDLMMPVMDGWTFSAWQETDAARAHIPVVITSAVGNGNRPLAVRPAAILAKPFDLRALVSVVRHVLGGLESHGM